MEKAKLEEQKYTKYETDLLTEIEGMKNKIKNYHISPAKLDDETSRALKNKWEEYWRIKDEYEQEKDYYDT